MIAALFVERGGVYDGMPGVDAWHQERDARLYAGPHPVVAHPPCARWGRYWSGGPSWRGEPKKIGDDGGCFEAALAAVRRWGGVLEHPEGSHAWKRFCLAAPPRSGGWISADFEGGWACCVEQGHYGHPARKLTWLYANGVQLLRLRWGVSRVEGRPMPNLPTGRRASRTGICQRLSARQRAATPEAFRDVLLAMAASTGSRAAA